MDGRPSTRTLEDLRLLSFVPAVPIIGEETLGTVVKRVTISLLLLLASCTGGVEVTDTPLEGKTPVVIDSDFGGDDMMALLYLLQQGEVSVRAVTVTGTGLAHCPAGGLNARAVLDHLGYEDVPVACGPVEPLEGTNAFPEEWRVGADALGSQLGLDVPDSIGSHAVDLLVEVIERSPQPVRLLAVGPLTNVAFAIDQNPRLVDNLVDIVIMGGAVDVNGSVDPFFTAEWNIWADPVAANRVLQSGAPITLVPLDATNAVPASTFFYDALEEQKATEEAELVYRFFEANPFNLEGGGYFFWDALAAVTMVDPEVAAYETRRLEVVEEAGNQQGACIDSSAGAEVRLAISAERKQFEEGFLTALNGGLPAVVEVPEPSLTVRFNGDTCVLDGPTTFFAEGEAATLVVEVVNQTELMIATVFGLHDGVPFERLQADAAQAENVSEPPPYWETTGTVQAFGVSMSGGTVMGRVELVPGSHAVLCLTEQNKAIAVTDLVVNPAPG